MHEKNEAGDPPSGIARFSPKNEQQQLCLAAAAENHKDSRDAKGEECPSGRFRNRHDEIEAAVLEIHLPASADEGVRQVADSL